MVAREDKEPAGGKEDIEKAEHPEHPLSSALRSGEPEEPEKSEEDTPVSEESQGGEPGEQELVERVQRTFSHLGLRSLKWLVILLVTVGVVAVLVRNLVGTTALWEALRGADWVWLGIPVAWMAFNLWLAALRWSTLVRAMEVRLRVGHALEAILTTWPLALLTPSRASDLLRAFVVREELPVAQGAGSVMMEKLIDVQSLCLMTMVAGVVTGLWKWSLLALAMLSGLWLAVWLVLRHFDALLGYPRLARIADKLERFFLVLHGLKARPVYFFAVSGMSLLAWVGSVGILYGLLMIFGAKVALGEVVVLWPLALFVGQLPLTIAGMGTRDTAFLTLLALTGTGSFAKAAVLAATLGYAVLTTLLPALLGLPLMLRFARRVRVI